MPTFPRTTRCLAAVLVSLPLWGGCRTEPSRYLGPLPVRNQHPAQLAAGRLLPRAARATPAGVVETRVDTALTSLFLAGSDLERSFRMDGEYLRVAPGARIGLGGGFDVAFELPFAHTSGGFLDEFVIAWHDWFGLPDQNRDDAPRGRFDVHADRSGVEQWRVEESSFEWLDVPVSVGWTAVEPDSPGAQGPSLTLRGGVELPLGDADRGYGSGEVDWMFGVAAEWRFADFAVQADLQHTLVGTPDVSRVAGLTFQDVTAAGLGIELPVHDRLSLLAQTAFETSVLRDFGLDRTDDPQWLLWTGARWRPTDRLAVELALGEDLSPFIAPDFSLWFGLRYDFGRSASGDD